MQNKEEVKFCITTVFSITSDNKEEAMKDFLESLRQLGAEDVNIKQLATNNRTHWQDYTENLDSIVYVEIVKFKKEST